MTKDNLKEVVSLICETYDNENLWSDYRHDKIKSEFEFAFKKSHVPAYLKPKFFVAVIDKEIIGVAGITSSYMSDVLWELSWATVKPGYQRKGVGTALTKHRIKWAKKQKKRGYFMVSTRYPKLFKKLGFTEFLKRSDDNSHSSFCYLEYK